MAALVVVDAELKPVTDPRADRELPAIPPDAAGASPGRGVDLRRHSLPMPDSQTVASLPSDDGTTRGGTVTVVDTYRNQRPPRAW